jgi:hypothetical protein
MKRRTILKAGAGLSPLLSLTHSAMSGQKSQRRCWSSVPGLPVWPPQSSYTMQVLTSSYWKHATVRWPYSYLCQLARSGLDIGASWIHGARPANPIAKLARKIGARTVTTEYEKAELYNGDGSALNSAMKRESTASVKK